MNYIGIDIGGTSIKGSLINEKGDMKNPFIVEIIKGEDQESCINRLIEATKNYIKEQNVEVDGIGLGIPGSIDTLNGVVTYSNNLYWENLHVIEMFKKHFTCDIKITNDANAAALGEAKFGAGKSYSNVVMITLGTGVGSGIILNGKLYEGYQGKGAEIGHSLLVMDGLPCTCGRKGCFEVYASATAIIRMSKEAMDKNPNSLMHEIAKREGKVNGKVPFAAAKENDEAANEVINSYVKNLGEGLLNICNIFRPECIVLSGGLANQKEYLIDRLVKYVKDREYGYPRSPETVVKTSELGYNSGMIGAASLFL